MLLPSLNRMLARDLIPLAIMGATAVLSRQAVLLGVLHHEAVVRSPVVVVGVALPTALSSLWDVSDLVCDTLLLQRLVWFFFLHFLQLNFEGHWDTLWLAKQLKQRLLLLIMSSLF